jgi:ferrous iron transport protein B
MPIVGLIAGALFNDSPWIATSAYFIGIGAVVLSGIILKKLKIFSGEPAPFVMELPGYHIPSAKNVFYGTWERGISFIKRAGSVILLASIIIWLLNSLSFEGGFHYIADGDSKSILNVIGEWIAYLFVPLGFGKWQAAVATVLGLVAKEEVVGVFGSLSSMADASLAFEMVESANTTGLSVIASEFFASSRLSAFSFMVFNLLCAPCFAAMGAIKREMNSAKWTWFAIGYMCVFAYAVSLCVYQIGLLFSGIFSFWTIVAFLIILAFLYFLLRPQGKTGGKL